MTLWNTGPEGDTFRPTELGPFFTICKTLSARGGTSIRVRSSWVV